MAPMKVTRVALLILTNNYYRVSDTIRLSANHAAEINKMSAVQFNDSQACLATPIPPWHAVRTRSFTCLPQKQSRGNGHACASRRKAGAWPPAWGHQRHCHTFALPPQPPLFPQHTHSLALTASTIPLFCTAVETPGGTLRPTPTPRIS